MCDHAPVDIRRKPVNAHWLHMSHAVKVAFSDETIKAMMLFEDKNPFRMAYVVDVSVETIEGRPALYNVLAVHDKFERHTPANQPDLFNRPS